MYDAEGHRVAKKLGGAITNEYLLDASGAQVIELDGSGNVLHTSLFANGKLFATYKNDGQTYFHFSDWLGTRRYQTNSAGDLQHMMTCTGYPFGDGLNCTGSGVDASEHHFTGKERDSETGLDYFGARYYGSNMGRWLSPDWSAGPEPVPYADLNNPQTLNLYSYVKNNPVTANDPDGHEQPPLSDEEVRRGNDAFVGSMKGLWNMAAGTWNTGAELLNAQGQSSGQTYMEVPTLPTASYDNTTQAVSGSLTQLATVVVSAVKGLTGSAASEAGTAGKAAGAEAGDAAAATGKGLGNPFKGKSAAEVDSMMKGKGMDPRGPDPAAGKGGYVNPKTGRSYHIDENNRFGEKPHVDVNRSKTYKGNLDKKKYPL